MLKRFSALLSIVLLLSSLPLLAQSTDFTKIFGPRPHGPRDRAMVQAQMIYDARADRFLGIVDKEFPIEAILLYQEIGLGLPVAWKQKNGQEFVAFPDARYYKPKFQSLVNVERFPGVVWRTWHVDSIQHGFCVPEVNPNFPPSLLNQNRDNCVALEVSAGLRLETN